ncbi:prolipoprotein diacylglyceryl transferase [Candidatus Margulisiibacteriota bacterium]
MHPELLRFGSITVFSYGTMVALGFLAATFWAWRHAAKLRPGDSLPKAKASEIDREQVLSLVLLVVLCGIIGARIFYVIQFWPRFAEEPMQILNIRGGGLVFYGGLFGGLTALFVYCRLQKLAVLKVLDLAAPAVILGYAIGRLGCFLNGCCYGAPTSAFWGVRFPDLPGLHHPAQLYSAVIALAIFGLLAFLYKRKAYNGQIIFWGIIMHSLYRFGIEFIRINPLYFGLSAAQWIALALIAITILLRPNK